MQEQRHEVKSHMFSTILRSRNEGGVNIRGVAFCFSQQIKESPRCPSKYHTSNDSFFLQVFVT